MRFHRIIALLSVPIIALCMLAACHFLSPSVGERDYERVERVERVESPDGRFVIHVIICQTLFPYGIEGKLCISRSKSTKCRFVCDFCCDGFEEVRDNLTWNDMKSGYLYRKSNESFLINLDTFPPESGSTIVVPQQGK